MTVKRKNWFWLIFIFVYAALYSSWLVNWKSDEEIFTLVGNIFSVLAGIIAATWLLYAAQKSSRKDKPFWFLLAAGAYSNFLAEFLWLTYENYLDTEVPYPGPPDFFYLLQVLFYLAAFIYKVTTEKKQHHFIKFIFDAMIIMTVASTFSWHFLLQPILMTSQVSPFSLVVSLAYPVGDLALLFGTVTLFLSMHQAVFKKTIMFLFLGLLTQIIADSSYLYLVSTDSYFSGSLIDPLFSAAVLLIGYTGLVDREKKAEQSAYPVQQWPTQLLTNSQIVLPYLNVTILFLFMVSRSNGIDVVTIGSSISILLVIIRQIFVLMENQKLLHQVHDNKEALEMSEYRQHSSPGFAGAQENDSSHLLPELPGLNTRIQFLAYHDSLTGLVNRAYFEEMLKQAVSNAELHNGSFAVMFLDLDNFKKINDTMGHDAGDQLLMLIADRLKACTRKDDVVARLGGDEFTFLIRDVSHPQNAAFIAEKIIYSLSQPYTVNGSEVSSSPSIGISLYPLNGTTPADLLKKADMAMYQVKENGKGNYRLA